MQRRLAAEGLVSTGKMCTKGLGITGEVSTEGLASRRKSGSFSPQGGIHWRA